MMKLELKNKWVKALRSGRYKQGKERLQSGDGANCCLGVLCRVARIPSVQWIERLALGSIDPGPINIKSLGLSSFQHDSLVDQNDVAGKTFHEIADWIEKNIRAK